MPSYYPCYPVAYDWGKPAAPAHPRGWYRGLYQLADFWGIPRVFPSALMQCIGRTIKGDCWWVEDWQLFLNYVAAFVGVGAPAMVRGGWGFTYGAHFAAEVGGPFSWGWYPRYDPSIPGSWTVELLNLTTSPAEVYDLRTMTHWHYNATPFASQLISTTAILIFPRAAIGEPWLNAI